MSATVSLVSIFIYPKEFQTPRQWKNNIREIAFFFVSVYQNADTFELRKGVVSVIDSFMSVF